MYKNILIVYDSESGSTGEIAELIAKELINNQIKVDVKIVGENISIESYDFVIVGSPNWYGKPTKNIALFLKVHNAELRRRQFAFYFTCMCLTKIQDNDSADQIVFPDSQFNIKPVPEEQMNNWQKTHAATYYREQLSRITPGIATLSVAVFKGRLDFSRLSFFHGLLMRLISMMVAEVSKGEYINAAAVRHWTKEIMK